MIIKKALEIKVEIAIIKQGKRYVAYSHALDLSTSGKNLKEAQQRFTEITDIFFEEVLEKNTLEEVLKDLGWEKIKKTWEPPKIVSQTSIGFHLPVAA